MSAPPGRGPSMVTTLDADGVHELVAEMRLVSIGEPAGPPKVLGTRATIGTSELADVRIEDRTSSRLHCEITLEQGRARVRDLGSRNGTFVDGVEIQAAFLHDGATLRVGSHELRFEIGQDRQRVPLYQPEKFGAMAGRSLAMRKIFAQLQKAAASDATVLLIGETGTGKEVALDEPAPLRAMQPQRAEHDRRRRGCDRHRDADLGRPPERLTRCWATSTAS